MERDLEMGTEVFYNILKKPADYEQMLDLQERTRERIITEKGPGTLFFLEHLPVYTSGLRGSRDDFIKPVSDVPVYEIRRGGELTWHGPGQLVIYPVVEIRKAGFQSIREFVDFFGKAIEKVLTEHCGISSATWDSSRAGVWVGNKKIAFSGLHFRKFVPVHGYSLNISCNTAHFNSIIPCGIPNCPITTIEMETGRIFDPHEISLKIIDVLK